MSADSAIQVPNPYAQLAWVTPPRFAQDLAIKLYAAAGASAILIWDILIHLPQDYQILASHRINILTVVFFFSRLATLAFILGLTIVTTAPIGNCNLVRYVSYLYPLTLPLTIFPFVPRVSAIYHNSKYVLAFFVCTWLAVLGTAILMPVSVQAVKIGLTDYCAEIKSHSMASIAALVLFVHDSLIFLATSWAFVSYSYSARNAKGVFKVILLGRNLPEFTKLILRDGQAYYLASLVIHVMFLSQYYTSSPFAFPCSFGNPSLVLTSNMAAYVYRNTRLGLYKDHTVATSAWQPAVEGTDTVMTERGPQPVRVVFDKSTTTTRHLIRGSVSSREETHVVEMGLADLKERAVEAKTDV